METWQPLPQSVGGSCGEARIASPGRTLPPEFHSSLAVKGKVHWALYAEGSRSFAIATQRGINRVVTQKLIE